jgi:hypothetical protein
MPNPEGKIEPGFNFELKKKNKKTTINKIFIEFMVRKMGER